MSHPIEDPRPKGFIRWLSPWYKGAQSRWMRQFEDDQGRFCIKIGPVYP